ncbi:MAG: hypothetical protein J5781_06710, partial [Clostridia bacterium]|nr:hypothetical protein [Clostridia bacterium]
KSDYPSFINTVSVMSPNTEYFELLIKLGTSDKDDPLVLDAVKDCFYRLLRALAYADIQNIRLGSPEYIATNISSSFNSSDERKKYVSGSFNETYDYYMYDYIGHAMRGGVNNFLEWKSDTEYDITYEVTYGETLTRNGILQLLSGRIMLRNNGDGSFTTVQGTLGHSSYTIDLSPITLTISKKKSATVTALDYSEKDYLVRLYMKNAPEVYSRWVVGGEFSTVKAEILSQPENAFLSDLSVVSPNNNYFELMFVIEESVWTGSGEQVAALKRAARLLMENMAMFGATEVHFGGDIHLFGAADTVNDIALFTDGSAFDRDIAFDSRSASTSIVDFFASYVDILSAASASPVYVAVFSSVKSGIKLMNDNDRYVLRLNVIDTWMGTDEQKNLLASACYIFMRDLISAGTVYCNGAEITTATQLSFYRDVVERSAVNDTLVFELPFTFGGSFYSYVYSGEYVASRNTVFSSCGAVVSSIDVRTATVLSSLKFRWTGTAGDIDKLNLAFHSLLKLIAESADTIYYGTDMSVFGASTPEAATELQLTTALRKGVNVFSHNSKELYDISYNADIAGLLCYNKIYVLFDGALSVAGSGSYPGEYGVTEGTMTRNVLYDVTVEMGAGRVLINP